MKRYYVDKSVVELELKFEPKVAENQHYFRCVPPLYISVSLNAGAMDDDQ